jgi:hypothetical protein
MSGRERQKIDFSFWFVRIGHDDNASYLQSAKSDQFVIVSSGCSIGIDIIAISQKRPIYIGFNGASQAHKRLSIQQE